MMRRAGVVAAVAACVVAVAAHADCTKLNGSYRFRSVEASEGESSSLAEFVTGSGRSKLFKVEQPGSTVNDWTSSQVRRRAKVTDVATTASFVYAPGSVRLHFRDAQGAELASLPLETMHTWTCRGDRLERSFNRTAGLGDVIRTEKIEESLGRDAAGALVHQEKVTVVEGGHGTRVREAHFPAAKR